MENKNRTSFYAYVKWAIALICGIMADVLCASYNPQGVMRIVVSGVIALLFFFCFMYEKNKEGDFLKLAYIVISALSGVLFSLECVFLIIFELITN